MFEESSIPLSVLAQDARALGTSEFERRHGSAFFVHLGALDAGLSPLLRTLTDHDGIGMEGGPGAGMHVFLLRSKSSNVFPDFITIGRAVNNDVVLAHPSVSKFHAYVRNQEGALMLYDAASANGSFANEDRVAVKGRGSPTRLTSGMRLRFGLVDVILLSVSDLRQLADSLPSERAQAARPS